jgi:DNA invertase Pin-like site-specific DNA recombinase
MYLRKSRADMDAEALGEMETLARHRKILSELARRQGLNVTHVYEEIVSGESISERPQMIRLLDDIHANLYDGVICMELERLARGDSRDQSEVFEAFKYTDTLIITPSKTYNPNNQTDEEYFEFGLFMSRREYKTINRRMQAGRVQSVKEGNYIGSVPPFGYDKIQLPHRQGYSLTPNSDSEYVRLIYEWYVNENLTPTKIADRLDSLGVKPRKGKHWSKESIRDILRNPTYTGKLRWNWRKNQKTFVDGKLVTTRPRNDLSGSQDYTLVDGKHPAIISDELFEAARAREGTCSRANYKNRKVNPFAGLIRCACGYSMTYQRQSGGARSRVVCSNQRYCHTKSIAYEDMVALILESLGEHLGEAKFKMENETDSSDTVQKQLIEKLEKDLAETTEQQNSLYDFLERKIYTPEVFIQRQNLLTERRNKLIAQIGDLRTNMPKPIDYKNRIFNIERAIETINTAETDIDKANRMLKTIIKSITYFRDENGDAKIKLDLIV